MLQYIYENLQKMGDFVDGNMLLDLESKKRYEEIVNDNIANQRNVFGTSCVMTEEEIWESFIYSEYKSRLEKSIEEEKLKIFNITKELKLLAIKKEIYSKYSSQFKELSSYVERLNVGLEIEQRELEALFYNADCELSVLQSELRILSEYIAVQQESNFSEEFLNFISRIPDSNSSSNSKLNMDDEPYDPYYHSEAYINDGWN